MCVMLFLLLFFLSFLFRLNIPYTNLTVLRKEYIYSFGKTLMWIKVKKYVCILSFFIAIHELVSFHVFVLLVCMCTHFAFV